MKIRLILGCAALGLSIAGFGQSSSSELPEAPSSTITPQKPKSQDPTPPAQTPQAQQQPAPADQQPTLTDLSPKQQQAPANPSPANAQEQQPTKPGGQKPTDVTPDPNGPETVIKVNANEVNVVFTVTDKHGRFVKDLKKEDIKVLDDNKPQQIRSFRSETDLPLRVGLLIDASNSIRDRFKFEQEAAIEFLNQIVRPRSDKAFVIGFDSVAEVTQDYTDSTESLARGVRMLKAGGGTALFDAVYYACREKLAEPPAGPNTANGSRRAMILLSDGEDNQSRVTREEAVEMAQRAEVIIYAISTNITGIKSRGDKVLERFAETTGGRLFTPFKLQDVADAFTEIQDELRSQYALSYHPGDFVKDGRYRTITIDAPNKKNLRVRARKGYYAPKPDNASTEARDGNTGMAKNN
jgi:VWFA-related protein